MVSGVSWGSLPPCLHHGQVFLSCSDPGAGQVTPRLSLVSIVSCRNPLKFHASEWHCFLVLDTGVDFAFRHSFYYINGIWEAGTFKYVQRSVSGNHVVSDFWWRFKNVLRHCLSNFNIYTSYPVMSLKCQFQFSESGARPGNLHF